MISNGYNKADIADRAQVSRAAVTKWFQNAKPHALINVEIKTLMNLATALKVKPDYFLTPSPDLSGLTTSFLWDYLYPNMESFVEALSQYQWPAVARLVQVVGFHDAKKISGEKIFSDFPKYAKYIKPARRKQLEILWPLYTSKI